jgi:excisionase family DNA binding protein
MRSHIVSQLDASDFEGEDLEKLRDILQDPSSLILINQEGSRVELPRQFFDHLKAIVEAVAAGRALRTIDEDEKLTTQAAANLLGVSRQHFVGLLETGKIPFHKVGTHRRIQYCDLQAFQQQRDKEREEAMGQVWKDVEEANRY